MNNYKQIIEDLKAFSEKPENVEVTNTGESIIERFGKEIIFKIIYDRENDKYNITDQEGQTYSYSTFLTKYIARLDILANRLIESRENSQKIIGEEPFVEGEGILKTFNNSFIGEKGKVLDLLKKECDDLLPFSTKVTFITADAGHGKTYLLKEFQYQQAKRYLKGESPYLFLHIDLQGRQLVRLDEAIMRDLGEIRFSGLFMSSIYTLMKKNFLVLAIDGFDELAAESGNNEALGSLSNLIQQMEGKGTFIAASRRTFFDHDDYIKKSKLLPRSFVSNDCVFNELKLSNWSKSENIQYLDDYLIIKNCSLEPEKTYDEISNLVQNNTEHAFLTKPFLFSRIIKGIVEYSKSPSEFIGNIDDSLDGIASIINQFIKREVSDKWITREGVPYLTEKQHHILLSSIAEEMWLAQSERISVDEIIFITKVLCDEWKINDDKRQTEITRMVAMHALLVPYNNDMNYRKFDHPEFKNYFIAQALVNLIDSSIKNGNSKYNNLKKFLEHSQLPDAVGLYTCNLLKSCDDIPKILDVLEKSVSKEWKPSLLHQNIGTLVPFLLNNYTSKNTLIFGTSLEKGLSKITYSGLIFENKEFKNIGFSYGLFININFRNLIMNNISFNNCIFTQILFDKSSKYNFENIIIENSEIHSIIEKNGDEISRQAYEPLLIYQILKSYNILWLDYEKEFLREEDEEQIRIEETPIRKQAYRFLNTYNRTSLVTDFNLQIRFKPNEIDLILGEIIPLLEKYNIIKEADTKQIRQSKGQGWRLLERLEDIFKADNLNNFTNLEKFWNELNNK
jgi:hypothetical protein